MPYIQKENLPKVDKRYFSVSDFSGGLNNKDSYMELRDNQSSDMLNVDIFKETGVVIKREGYSRAFDYGFKSDVKFIDMFCSNKKNDELICSTLDGAYSDGYEILKTTSIKSGLNYNNNYNSIKLHH